MNSKAPSSNVPTRLPEGSAATLRSRYPFVPYGLVPLVGLAALMIVALVPFAFGEVQAATQASATSALEKGGFHWAKASASGQWVVLEGRPPTQDAARAAEDAVRNANAGTLFGDAAPATWVISHFTWTEDPLLPSGVTRPRPDGAAVPPPTEAQAEACDQTMASLLSRAHIEFDTASAMVGDASDALLDVIASAASYCHGVLRIEGHTDNVGRTASNVQLSRRRAEAVRAALIERGVPADRLVADGLGSGQPVAGNDTAAGRARNRRIEIRSVRSPPT